MSKTTQEPEEDFYAEEQLTSTPSLTKKSVFDDLSFEEIVENCKKEKKKFIDPNFPPNDSSIFVNEKTKKEDKNLHDVKPVWCRPPKDHVFWSGNFEVSDLKQGGVGDCYLLSALNIISQKIHLIQNLFVNSNAEYGVYSFRFYKNGWKEIIIDDLIPCHEKTLVPIFTQSKSNEYWFILLEKAYAKFHGTYQNLDMGHTTDAFFDLTGGIASTYFSMDFTLDSLWDLLKNNHQSDTLMAASSNVFEEGTNTQGILSQHAYTVLQVHDDDHSKLIKLRNPHGTSTWTGKWHNKDQISWTSELKDKLKLNDESFDGTFWMDVIDFKEYFKAFSLCKLIPENYERISLKGKWEKSKTTEYNYKSFDLSSEGKTKLFITFHQPDKRLTQTKYKNVKIWVSPAKENHLFQSLPIIFGPTFHIATRDFSIEVDLDVSIKHYKIYIMSLENETERYTLRCASNNRVHVKESKEMKVVEKTSTGVWKYPYYGGCQNYFTFAENPTAILKVKKNLKFMVLLKSKNPETLVGIGFNSHKTGVVLNTMYEKQFDSFIQEFEPGIVEFLFSTFKPGVNDKYKVTIVTDSPYEIEDLTFDKLRYHRYFYFGALSVAFGSIVYELRKYIKS
eukprot:gene9084-1179_t